MENRMRSASGVVCAVLSSATFGLIPLFSVPLLGIGIGSPTILFYRFTLAAAMMAVVMAVSGRSFYLPRAVRGRVLLLSVLYAATAILLVESYKYIPSGIATTIHFLYPLVVTLSMSFIFRETIGVMTYVAVVLSLAGVALLAWGRHTEGDFPRGVVLALLTVVTYAAYIIGVMKSRVASLDSVTLTFYVVALGALLFFLYALATEGIESVHRWSSWRDLVMLALVCTVLSDLLLVMAIKRVGSTLTSILGSMEPLTAVVVGVVYFDEHFDTSSVIGLILIIFAVILVILGAKHNSAPHE